MRSDFQEAACRRAALTYAEEAGELLDQALGALESAKGNLSGDDAQAARDAMNSVDSAIVATGELLGELDDE